MKRQNILYAMISDEIENVTIRLSKYVFLILFVLLISRFQLVTFLLR